MNEISFDSSCDLVPDQDKEILSPDEFAIYKEKFLKLEKLFDRPGQKVISELPSGLKLREIIGITKQNDKTTKITFRRFHVLYLCWVPTSEISKSLSRIQKERESMACE